MTSLSTELPKDFLSEKHTESLHLLQGIEGLHLDRDRLFQLLHTVDYLCISEVPYFLLPIILSSLTKIDIEKNFTEFQWIRKELLLLLACHQQELVYDRALLASSQGLLHYLRYMHNLRIMPLVSEMMVHALPYPVVREWLWEKGVSMNKTVFTAGVATGNKSTMRWLLSKKCPVDAEAAYRAAVDAHCIETIVFLFHELDIVPSSPDNQEDIFIAMVLQNDTTMIEWFLEKGWNLPSAFTIASFALPRESINVLRMMDERMDFSIFYRLLSMFAIRDGQIRVLSYFHKEKNFQLSASMILEAVRHRRLDVLRWLKENGCPWEKKICLRLAVEMEHFEIAQWIRDYNPLRNDQNIAFCDKTLKELKILCRTAGLTVSGTKAQLIDRLVLATISLKESNAM